ncbi:MAG: cation:proton antiporter [Gammaproteobacteria bacterium]|nr:cation:proton antiporter [Gammaproteobacteria bacterium]
MDFIWILFAFACGLIARSAAMPPLIGYLIAGFALHAIGINASDNLVLLSNLGITLMLFTIGLKLKVNDLLAPSVWLSSSGHMLIWSSVILAVILLLLPLSLALFEGVTWEAAALIGFALSFSSTVCIVKILEESGEIKSRHGKLAVGVLIMQDIFAVVFMVMATGILPSTWAFALVALWLLRKPIYLLLERVGHGELLPLLGFFLAFGGYELFSLVGIKGDLGALILGILVAGHNKSTELYKSLIGFKDLFLIGFFLSIGFTALPTIEMVVLALGFTVLLPLKILLFFIIFNRFGLRARTSFLSALVLGNFSEFGLIVIALCIEQTWLAKEWLVILALSVSFSFIITSITYRQAHRIYRTFNSTINRFENSRVRRDDTFKLPQEAEILVIGMGRVGKGTYHSLCKLVENRVWGIDSDEERVKRLQDSGYRVLFGDGEDSDLWQNMDLTHTRLVLIALPYIQDIKNIQDQLRSVNYPGKVVAIARYEDQIEQLTECGIDRIFNFYTEAGVGFAEESLALLNSQSELSQQN